MSAISNNSETDRELIRQILKRLIAIEEHLNVNPVPTTSDWISENEAARLFDYSKDSIRRARRNGVLIKVKTSIGGRKVKVSRKECEQKLQLRIA